MTVKELMEAANFTVLNEGVYPDREITVPYCCDLLSVAMGRMPAGSAWVTVMGNVNTLAVASLADVACIILAEDSKPDETALSKAIDQGVTLMTTELPIFDAALRIHSLIHA